MIALLDTNILTARETPNEPAPGLSGYDGLVVSSSSWPELTRGLHVTSNLAGFKAWLARLTALRAAFGPGIAFDDACAQAHDDLLRHVTERGSSAVHMYLNA